MKGDRMDEILSKLIDEPENWLEGEMPDEIRASSIIKARVEIALYVMAVPIPSGGDGSQVVAALQMRTKIALKIGKEKV